MSCSSTFRRKFKLLCCASLSYYAKMRNFADDSYHRRLIMPKCGRVLRMCETTEKDVIVKA
jgi:hypothetical protein